MDVCGYKFMSFRFLMKGKQQKKWFLFSSKKENMEKSLKYVLQKYQRSNQDTLIFQRPLVCEGEWIQSGDILADCSTSFGGELCLGKNIFIAYMPWEGYNYEDAILISQRLVTEDVYTSIHIESYEVETRSTKFGKEEITKKIPEVPESQLSQLDERGIVRRGTSVKEGDILVGKVTPVQKKFLSAYEKLLYTILEKELLPMRDSSLRTPKGLKAKVLEVKILNFSTENKKKTLSGLFRNFQSRDISTGITLSHTTGGKSGPFFCKTDKKSGPGAKSFGIRNLHSDSLHGRKKVFSPQESDWFPRSVWQTDDFVKKKDLSFFVPSFSKNAKIFQKKQYLFCAPSKGVDTQKNFLSAKVSTLQTLDHRSKKNKRKKKPVFWFNFFQLKFNCQTPEKVQVYLVEKRKIQVGDKMSGRHGNKGIVSQILPVPDMPFLPDGTPIDMVLNPLGVPSRMNVGQIYGCILGLASKYLQQYYRIQPFDEIYGPQASRSFTFSKLYEARQKTGQKWLFNPCSPGKIQIFDGQTGEPYENPVTVGISYILKLVHLVDDKIHARSTGPYSLVTQQPLKGRSKYGGQRLGEMEVWAIEAYGAAFVLLEMLTLKSDDISGRMTLWSNILLNMPIYIGTPESFKVLVCELQALCLDMGLFRLNKKGFLTQIEHLMQLP
jgi:DNA-directed RNA polymerase subunit beta